jgi:hypothetical protein
MSLGAKGLIGYTNLLKYSSKKLNLITELKIVNTLNEPGDKDIDN